MDTAPCVGGHVVTNISPSFLCVWKPFLWAFSPFLKYIYMCVYFKPFYFLSNPFLPPSLRYTFQATSRFHKVNPFLQRSDQIRVHAARCPPLHSAPAPADPQPQDQGFIHTYIYLFIFFFGRLARIASALPSHHPSHSKGIIARITHVARSFSSSNTPWVAFHRGQGHTHTDTSAQAQG